VAPPEPVEREVVRLPVVATPHEDRFAGRTHLLSFADVHERQGAGEVDRRTEIHGETGRAEDPREDDGLAKEPLAIDVERREDRAGRPGVSHRP
jgi:hypothetical protein